MQIIFGGVFAPVAWSHGVPWADAATVDRTLYATELRNLGRYGYGVKSFMLSMLETAVEISGAAADAAIMAGCSCLRRG